MSALDPPEPYLLESDGAMSHSTSVYQSISCHSAKQDKSFEGLRLEHYNIGRDELKQDPGDTSKLMATRQLSALSTTHPFKSIRAAADGWNKHAVTGECSFNGGVIVFLVGTEVPRRFTIHEGLIRTRSDFVQLALRGEWKEARERTIPLPEDDPDVFSVYQQFLYGGLIYTSYKNAPSRPDDEYKVLVKAYILGEKIMDQEFKDSIVDAIIEKLRTLRRFDTQLTDLVSDNTPFASPLRRLWMDAYYHFGSSEWLDPSLAGSPINAEFMAEFSRHQMQSRTGFGSFGPYAMFLSCTYHGHGIRPCCRQTKQNIG